MTDPIDHDPDRAAAASASGAASDGHAPPDVDFDAIERDLDAVEAALARLEDDTYWTDEVTGEPIPDDTLADDPTARRA